MGYKLAILPMRAQIFTEGHAHLIRMAKQQTGKVAILLGSHNVARSVDNPFGATERIEMIRKWVESSDDMEQDDLIFEVVNDFATDEEWKEHLGLTVDKLQKLLDCRRSEMIFVGSNKDDDVESRNTWTDLESHHILPLKIFGGNPISATIVRDLIFSSIKTERKEDHLQGMVGSGIVPESTYRYLVDYINLNSYQYKRLCKEANGIRESINKFSRGKISHTGDALPVYWDTADIKGELVTIPKLLMVKRGGAVGNGLWAIAGGFMEKDETFEEAAKRELYEELNVDFTCKKPVCSVTYSGVNRDPRGRVITEAFRFDITAEEVALLDVKAQDDAEDYAWKYLDELKVDNTFLDHYYIIQDLMKTNREGV